MKHKKKKKMNYAGISFIVLCLCGVVTYQRMELKSTLEQNKKQLVELNTEKEELLTQKDEISDYESYVKTKKYIEQVAREKLGLVYEDEIVFKSEDK